MVMKCMQKEILKIEKMDHQGRGIGKLNDKIVFVPFTTIGDEIKFKITKNKKNFCEGEVVEYIKRSCHHIEQTCPYYGTCGGCDLRHISYDEQLKFKQNKVREIFDKFTKISSVKINNIIESKLEDNYRNKLTLKVDENLCLNKKSSHDYIRINECKLASSKINKIIKVINNYDLSSISSVVIRSSYFTDDSMVVFYVKKGVKFQENLEELEKIVTTIIFKYFDKDYIYCGKGNIIEKLGNLSFKISGTSFFQVNSLQTLNLYNLILEKCKLNGAQNVYDLYSGTGTIGLFLSKYCKKVMGIEINKEACLDARENAKINGIKNYEVYNGDVADLIKTRNEKVDIIVVDPPRSGLDNITINNMIRLNPKKIIYVSCDPVTLARDLNILDERYELCEVTPVDMFPNTYHVECLVLMSRKEQ